MEKAIGIALVVLLGTIGFSAYAYTVYLPSISNGSTSGYGTLSIYLADPPPSSPTLKYLVVNVSSVTLKYSSNQTELTTSSSSTASSTNGTTTTSTSSDDGGGNFENRFVYNVSSSVGTNVNITKLQGSSLLLGSTSAPAGNVTGIILNITGARAFWTNGNSTQLKVVADGKLMINVHFAVQSAGTTDLTIGIVPGDIHVSPGQASVLRPVIIVHAVSSGPSGTQSTETTETETESNSSSSTSTA
jgi:Domain of unknown function (DUF4382)